MRPAPQGFGVLAFAAALLGCNTAVSFQQLVNSQVVGGVQATTNPPTGVQVGAGATGTGAQGAGSPMPSGTGTVGASAPSGPVAQAGDGGIVSNATPNGAAAALPLELVGVKWLEGDATRGPYAAGGALNPPNVLVDGKPQRGESLIVLPQLRSTDGKLYENLRFSLMTENTSTHWSLSNANTQVRGVDVGLGGVSWCFDRILKLGSSGSAQFGCTPHVTGYPFVLSISKTCPPGKVVSFRLDLDDQAGRSTLVRFALDIP